MIFDSPSPTNNSSSSSPWITFHLFVFCCSVILLCAYRPLIVIALIGGVAMQAVLSACLLRGPRGPRFDRRTAVLFWGGALLGVIRGVGLDALAVSGMSRTASVPPPWTPPNLVWLIALTSMLAVCEVVVTYQVIRVDDDPAQSHFRFAALAWGSLLALRITAGLHPGRDIFSPLHHPRVFTAGLSALLVTLHAVAAEWISLGALAPAVVLNASVYFLALSLVWTPLSYVGAAFAAIMLGAGWVVSTKVKPEVDVVGI